jgi:hypothetical protein
VTQYFGLLIRVSILIDLISGRIHPTPLSPPSSLLFVRSTAPTARNVAACPSRHGASHIVAAAAADLPPLILSVGVAIQCPECLLSHEHPAIALPEPPERRVLTKHRLELSRFRRWALSFSSASSCASPPFLDASISAEPELPVASPCRAMDQPHSRTGLLFLCCLPVSNHRHPSSSFSSAPATFSLTALFPCAGRRPELAAVGAPLRLLPLRTKRYPIPPKAATERVHHVVKPEHAKPPPRIAIRAAGPAAAAPSLSTPERRQPPLPRR